MSEKEKILVHACCASCAGYVLPHLAGRFDVTAFFYNPNIHPESEYRLRLEEMRSVCRRFDIPFLEGVYDPDTWWKAIEPHRHLPERSERCWQCYRLRLEETARTARRMEIGLITTTLSVSPHKIYARIEEIGREAAAQCGLAFHAEDFKKRDGFKISVQTSRELGLTRQGYCGCTLSLEEAGRRKREKT